MITKNQEKIHTVQGIKIGYTDKKITSYGGFSLLGKFFEKIELQEHLNQIMPMEELSPNAMAPASKLMGFMTLAIAGASRFSHMLYLGHPECIKEVFGLERLPLAGTTLTRYFNKIKTMLQANQVSDSAWKYIKKIVNWDDIKEDWLRFDSTVITRYGNQEGAKKGYHPKKKGRPAHHPILAFLNSGRIVIDIWNRAGDTCSSNNILPFFEKVYNRLIGVINIKGILADAGFYDLAFIKSIESKGLTYIITARLYYSVQSKIYSLKNWQAVEAGIWVSEFEFQHDAWDKKYRYVVIRQSIKQKKNPLGKQLKLFETDDESNGYRYGIWITNLDEEAVSVWRTIRRRANDENVIKELKEDLALSGFVMQGFFATEAAFSIRVLLYNLLLVFRTIFLPEKEQNHRISTLRFKYFTIPAHLGRSSTGKWLRLSTFPKKLQQKIQSILDSIQQFSLPNLQLHCI